MIALICRRMARCLRYRRPSSRRWVPIRRPIHSDGTSRLTLCPTKRGQAQTCALRLSHAVRLMRRVYRGGVSVLWQPEQALAVGNVQLHCSGIADRLKIRHEDEAEHARHEVR